MTPRYERLMFRVALVGLVVVLGFFGYRTVVDPTVAPQVRPPTTTTVPGEPTTTAVPDVPFAITSPRDQARIGSGNILLAGVGSPGAVVARGDVATSVDARGVWSLRLDLAPGPNVMELVEALPDGEQRTASITIHFEA